MDNFEQWVNTHAKYLFNWALFKTSNIADSEDLVQDTFIAAYKGLSNFDHRSLPRTWLVSILKNKLVDYYRKRNREQNVFIQDDALIDGIDFFVEDDSWNNTLNPEYCEEEIDEVFDQVGISELLETCIEHLPIKWGACLRLKFLENHNGKKICELLEISQANYWQILHRAKLNLRYCIQKRMVQKTTMR